MAFATTTVRRKILAAALWACAWFGVCMQAAADLRAPAWYDEGAAVPDWHYRVPINSPGGANVGSTVEVDVDFVALLAAMNVDTSASSFDPGSVRVVRSGGALAAEQEFTDAIFNGVLDAGGNGRGQVRFILQDAPAAGNYWLYFDIAGNGAKPANPAAPINGHFELSNGTQPTGWTTAAVNTNGNENNEVYATNLGQTVNLAGGCGTGGANGLDVSPNNSGGNATGQRWHLLGFRDRCEDGSGNELVRLSRTITVPSGAAAGVLEFYFQVQAFDGISNNTNYDWFQFSVNGTNVNHNNLGIDNSTAPALRIDNNRLGRNGYGGLQDFGWKRAQLNLSAYAGSTITFRIQSRHSAADNSYRAWIKIDDVVWSRQVATLGQVEAFGVNIIDPNDTAAGAPSEYRVGETLVLSAQIDVDVPLVLADVYDDGGAQVASAVPLFDDGTHGDAVAGDRVWTNDGSVGADATYTFSGGPFGSGWLVRVFALDQSVAANGVTAGLLMIPGAATTPESQANFYNVDEQTFSLRGALVDVAKSLETIQDPISVTEPKSIPGAWIRYEVRVENQGPDGLDDNSISIVDEIPQEVSVCVAAACTCSGLGCTQVDPVHYDDTGSPIATGLTYDYSTQVEYSTDGTNFNYVPQPDGEGFDANVRYVRIRPSGAMNQPSGADNAQFELKYVVRLE